MKQYIIVTGVFRKEGRRWLAECPELGTATFGRSLTDAETKLNDAIELHLTTLDDVEETERFLKEHGIDIHRDEASAETISVDAPTGRGTFVRPVQISLGSSESALVA